jgi:hypothetical protein
MTNLIKSDIGHYALAMVSALVFSSACVGLAVTPAAAGSNILGTPAGQQASVESTVVGTAA